MVLLSAMLSAQRKAAGSLIGKGGRIREVPVPPGLIAEIEDDLMRFGFGLAANALGYQATSLPARFDANMRTPPP